VRPIPAAHASDQKNRILFDWAMATQLLIPLVGECRGGRKHRDLMTTCKDSSHSPNTDDGLATTNVANEQTTKALALLKLPSDLLHGGLLARREFKWENA
jgi:hypothetical protein